jgi:hypothetical protein
MDPYFAYTNRSNNAIIFHMECFFYIERQASDSNIVNVFLMLYYRRGLSKTGEQPHRAKA